MRNSGRIGACIGVRIAVRLVAGAWLGAVLGAAAQTAPVPPGAAPDTPLAGYGAEASVAERALEQRFREGIDAARIRESMRRLTARPHHVGSAYGRDNAEWLLARFREWGFDAHLETFKVLFPTPKERVLELTAPRRFRARLQEPAIALDPTSGQAGEQLPTYNAYSADGDVTAPLVYVNYGTREDYETLERLGVSVRGAIVIARYGHGWRGIKPKVAAEHGAVGCIIYSDPAGDGYAQGEVYPSGGWRNRDSVQRGSVMDTDYPGDPLTPGLGATEDAPRLALKDARTITKIPVLPVSAADAEPLLAALSGPLAPADWRGALAFAYHVGPGAARVHLKVLSNWDLKPVYDVVATLRGAQDPDAWVLRGNHHDAWVNGADDPISGLAPMLEEARGLSDLYRAGWRPKRTIIYLAWDGEEPGLLGSVEWVETHLAELQAHAVVYVNSDESGRGFLSPGGTADLEPLVSDVARGVVDPETGLSTYQRAHLYAIAQAKSAEDRAQVRQRTTLELEALGDGSDFTAFQDYAGIPTLDLSFGGEDSGTQYHSIYDDFHWYTHFADPDFGYGRALAQTAGSVILRLADAPLLPFDYAAQVESIDKFVVDLEKRVKDRQEEYAERALELKEGVYAATRDPRQPLAPPKAEAVPPFLNFAPLHNALARLKAAGERHAAAVAALGGEGIARLDAARLARANADLRAVSRLFLDPRGLPERPWFKNAIYAPGAYTGYDAAPIASVREYLDQKAWTQADAQIPNVARVLGEVAAGIEGAAADLERPAAP